MVTSDKTAIEIVRGLSAAEIREQLDKNESEREALLILLRAAQATERRAKRDGSSDAK